MLKKMSSFILLFLLLVSMSVPAWAYTAEIPNAGTNRYKAVRLTPDIYNNTDDELSNLLLKDDKGEVVPYFINRSYQTVNEVTKSYSLTLINKYIKDDAFYFDYTLAQPLEQDVLATSIEFGTAGTDFAKTIEILGSYDNLYWEVVQKDTIYEVDGNVKLAISFAEPKKYTHYRFKINNNLEKIKFDFVTLHYSTSVSEQGYFVETIEPAFHVEEQQKNTVVSLEGLKNLKIYEITIETDSIFKRKASVLDMKKQIYNLEFADTKYIDTTISLNQRRSRDEILNIVISNYDDKPITINKVIVKYVADELVFEGKSDQYTLEFDDKSDTVAPVYDIHYYKEQILQQPLDLLNITDLQIIRVEEAPSMPQKDYLLAFNIAISVVAALLGILILYKLKGKA